MYKRIVLPLLVLAAIAAVAVMSVACCLPGMHLAIPEISIG